LKEFDENYQIIDRESLFIECSRLNFTVYFLQSVLDNQTPETIDEFLINACRLPDWAKSASWIA
jgi:hypothetical protein